MLVYFLVCLLPAALWLWWIRSRDLYEPEPVSLILQTFFGGVLMAFPAILIERLLQSWLISRPAGLGYTPATGSFIEAVLYCFVIIAPVEEFLKYRTVRSGAYRSAEFNEPMDGVVYMSSAAIGFATLENALYMQGFGPVVLAIRMLLSTFLHVACSSIIGYYLGLGRFRPPAERRRMILRGFALAILIHGAYDFLALYQPIASLLALLLMLTGIGLMRQAFLDDIDRLLAESPFRPRKTLLKRRDPAAERRHGLGTPPADTGERRE
jgi:protease PrsW